MNKKKIILTLFICAQAISLLGIATQTASVNQQQPQIQISYEQKLQATCDYMQKENNAYLCTDAALLEKFNAIQKDLNIDPMVLLFVSKYSRPTVPDSVAYYATCTIDPSYIPAICIVTSRFDGFSDLEKTWILAHELRHHLQQIDPNIQKQVIEYAINYGMSYAQSKEYDADKFGIQYATKNCPCCLRELQRSLERVVYKFITYRIEKSPGYFQWHDFNALIKKTEHNPVYCSNHKTLK